MKTIIGIILWNLVGLAIILGAYKVGHHESRIPFKMENCTEKIPSLGNCVSKTYEIYTFSGLLKSITKYKNLTDVIESFNIKTCDGISCRYSFHNLTGKRKYLVFVNFISTT